MKYRKVLVTGGAGFIGAHLVKKLVELGCKVTVVDDLSRGKKKNLKTVWKKIKFYKLDLKREEKIRPIFKRQELIFNLAALNTGVDFDEGRTQVMFEHNMLLQMIPLRVAAQCPSIKKFIQISSASVYSREAMEHQVPTPETADTSNPEPSKLGYGLAKKMGENLASWYSENTKLKTVSVRFINVFGEQDHHDAMGHFIPMMVWKCLEAKKKLEVFGSGKQCRSFLYVEDAVSALLLLSQKGKNGEAYNVDSNNEHSVAEVVKLICKYLGKEKLKLFFNKKKPEGSQRRLLDSSKLQTLGWKPKISFDEGLARTVKSMQSEWHGR